MRKYLTDDAISLIRELHAQGVSHRKIAARLGCTRSTVQYQLSDERKAITKFRHSDVTDAKIKSLVASGLTFETIAKDIGISKSAACRRAGEIGVKSNFYFNWTEESDARLRQLLSEGKPFSQVAMEMGIEKGMAIGRARRIGAKSSFQQGQKVAGLRRQRNRSSPRKQRGMSAVLVGEVALPPLRSVAEPAAASPPTPAPIRRTAASSSAGKSVGPLTCEWMYGDPSERRYCGKTCWAKPGHRHQTSWCKDHYDQVFVKVRLRDWLKSA